MKLFERLGIKNAADAAVVTLHEYLSNRSVALLLRDRSGGLDIGSGIAIEMPTIGWLRPPLTTYAVWNRHRLRLCGQGGA
jgi:hypothetical protein